MHASGEVYMRIIKIIPILLLTGCMCGTFKVAKFCEKVCEKNEGCEIYFADWFGNREYRCNDGSEFDETSKRVKNLNETN